MERTAVLGISLAEHIRSLRVRRSLTLQGLAEASGVSRATMSRIENGEVSPTVDTLGRLASALSLPISQLLLPMEQDFAAHVPRDQQSIWQDPENGFERQSISPPSGQLKLELIECRLEAHRKISYARPAVPGHEHHLVLLSGTLRMTVDGTQHDLGPGDCLRYRLRGPSTFETKTEPVRYIIALS